MYYCGLKKHINSYKFILEILSHKGNIFVIVINMQYAFTSPVYILRITLVLQLGTEGNVNDLSIVLFNPSPFN